MSTVAASAHAEEISTAYANREMLAPPSSRDTAFEGLDLPDLMLQIA